MNKLIDKPVFVCGVPKSGTTLVGQLLSNHPDFCIDVDMEVSLRFLEFAQHVYFDALIQADHSRDPINERCRYLFADNHKIIGAMCKDFFSRLHTGFGTGKRWGSSSVVTVYHRRIIENWYPEATYVIVVRDPRDVWASYKKSNWPGKKTTVEKIVQEHRNFFEIIQRNEKNILVIPYEDVISNPKIVYERLTLDIPKNYLHGVAQIYKYRGSSPIEAYTEKDFLIPNGVGRWKNELPDGEAFEIERLLSDFMASHGYAIANRS